MKAVGVKELKARLSEHLRAVRAGETVLVTDRHEVIAELRPPAMPRGVADSPETVLELLAESGDVTRAALAKGAWRWTPQLLNLATGTADRILGSIREDRES